MSMETDADDKVVATYLILIQAAAERGTTYCDYIGKQIGAAAISVQGLSLKCIERYCLANGLPNLFSIVVRKGTDEPVERYGGSRDTLRRDREEVYAFPWADLPIPTPEEFNCEKAK